MKYSQRELLNCSGAVSDVNIILFSLKKILLGFTYYTSGRFIKQILLLITSLLINQAWIREDKSNEYTIYLLYKKIS